MPTTKGKRGCRRISLLLTLLLLLGGIFAVAWFGVVAMFGVPDALGELGPPSSELNEIEQLALSAYLLTFQDQLNLPAGNPSVSLEIEVDEGQTASDVVNQLELVEIVADGRLLLNFLRYRGLDRGIQAGHYELSGEMSIIELAETLQRASPSERTLTVLEGWRREQIADLIDRHSLSFDGGSFLVASLTPPEKSALWAIIEPLSSLEGFLFPDTYQLEPDAAAEDLVLMMLDNFDQRVDGEMRDAFAQQGLTLVEAVTLASIVEREAVVPEERPIIAGVFLNRLKNGMRLEADPTVQYALGRQPDGNWWKRSLTHSDLEVPSAYNTYVQNGLPPGPIANPGLASLQAVAFPARTDYFYFRARCDGSGRHAFAETYERHLENSCQ
jgi:UPF0755 protein